MGKLPEKLWQILTGQIMLWVKSLPEAVVTPGDITMRKLVLALPGILVLSAAVVATAEVCESLQGAGDPVATALQSEESPLTLVEGDEASAALWVETGRRLQDTRKARLPQPKAPTRRR